MVKARRPTLLRRVIANGIASTAVVLLLSLTLYPGGAVAASRPAIRTGAIGGVVVPSAGGGVRAKLLAANVYGGPATSGTSPGGGSPPLLYGGGPVMHAVTTQVVAWAPAADPFPSGYVSGYEQYLTDMSAGLGLSSNISSVAAQYSDASGPALSSLTNNAAIPDTDAYPASGCSVGTSVCLTEDQILTELSTVITAHALPVDEEHSYIVLLPPNIDTCFDSSSTSCETQAFCGYHTAFSLGSATTTFTLLPYPESSYSNSGRGQCYTGSQPPTMANAVDALDSIGAHELLESVTDPLVGSGYADAAGEEIADECAWTYGSYSAATGGGDYNQLVNGDQYLIQEMWSNQAGACVQGAASPAQATISVAGSPPPQTPTDVSVALTGDSAGATGYEWSYQAPDGTTSSDVSTAASPSLTFPSTGTYTVWVEVTDAAGGTVTGVRNVTVAGLPAPIASFSDSYVTSVPAAGSAVSFTSTSTASSAQSIMAAAWSFGDGSSGSGTSVSHTYAAAGTYTVTLRVTQGNGRSATTSQTVTVANPPTAAISSSSAPVAGSALTLSSGATPGAGAITAYSWDLGDGSSSTAASPSHVYTSAGTYTVTLTVTQTDGLQATVTKQLTITPAPVPPTAAISWSPISPTAGSSVSFASGATPGTGPISAYSWNFGDGDTSTSPAPSHTYSSAGTRTVTLTVTQSDGLTTTVTASIGVAAAAVVSAPTVSFSIATGASARTAGSAIAFDSLAAAGSGSITAYSWSFGDGAASTAADPSHGYARSGTYLVTLTVTQTGGLTASAQQQIVIAPAAHSSSSSTTTTSGTGGGSGSPSTRWSAPSSWLLQTIRTADSATTKIRSLLRSGGSRMMLTAPQVSGELVITWRARVHHRSTVIARGRGYVLVGVTPNLAIRLTRAGRSLLARERQVRVFTQATFSSRAGQSRVSRRLKLTR